MDSATSASAVQPANHPTKYPKAHDLDRIGLTLTRTLGILRLVMPMVIELEQDCTSNLVYSLEAVDELILNATYDLGAIEDLLKDAEAVS